MILVIGEALIDLIGDEGSGGHYSAVVGGANANVALALAVRGEQQRFLGRISSDGFGRQIASHLSSHGVDLSLSVDATEQTTLAVATIDSSGVASYSFYTKDTADWAWTEEELPTMAAALALGASAIQYGCLGMAIGPGNQVIEAWLKSFYSEDSLTLSHDLNIRPAVGFEREAELERVLRVNAQSHIIKASDADIEWLYGLEKGADLDAIAAEWSRGKLVVVTKGPAGVSLYRDGNRTDVAGQKINLVDTVGAGDTFMANFLGELSS
ncbi:MAG: carbohydrate kinase, partial [Actinobacteria bacterium]|nr:carbohydrate kinase [Actinomycetota bacterium]